MKKLLIISALLLGGLVTRSEAQHFVASFGIEHSWGVPDYVTHTVYDRFYNYDWVHANRVYHGGGYYSFNVLLQRGNTFLEVNFNDHGHYRVVNRYNHYPLAGHVCGDFCGYHEYYYNTYYNICHSHNHWGHNHVIYRPRPVTYVYGHYRTYPRYNNTTIIYNNGPSKHYKQYKKGSHKPQYSQQDGKNPYRIRLEDRYPTRRSSNATPVNAKYSDGQRRPEADRNSRQQYGSQSGRQQYGSQNQSGRQQYGSQNQSGRQEYGSQGGRQQYRQGTDTRSGRQQMQQNSRPQNDKNTRQQYNRSGQQTERSGRQQYERKSSEKSNGRGKSSQSRGRGRGN